MNLIISASPHIDSGATTRKIMGDVLLALCPALIAAVVIFGWRALLVTAVCAAACVFFEWGFEKICHKPSTIGDLSAVVTGVILAYNLPVTIPLWQAVFGCLVAIVAVQDHDRMGLPRRGLLGDASCPAGCRPVARFSAAAARQPWRLHR